MLMTSHLSSVSHLQHVIEMDDDDDSPEKQSTKGKTAINPHHDEVIAPGKEEGGGGGIGMRSSKSSVRSGYGNTYNRDKGSSIDSRQEKDEGQNIGESKAEAKQESNPSIINGKGKSRPPLPAPLQTKTPYAIPSSLSQRLAGANTSTLSSSSSSSTSDIPFSDQYSPSDAMGHINLQSKGGMLSGGKNNTFAFPEVKVMSVVQADANFVDANWDDVDSGVEHHSDPKNSLKGQRITTSVITTTDISSMKKTERASCSSSVKADDNWLNDNFDD